MVIHCNFRLVLGLITSLLYFVDSVAQPIIKYDGSGKAPLPFDRPFILQTEFKGGTAIEIYVYEVKIVAGKRAMTDPAYAKYKAYRPSFVIKPLPGDQKEGSLNILMPALKPDKDFDLLIKSNFSKENSEIAYQILTEIDKRRNQPIDTILKTVTITSAFRSLYRKVNVQERVVFDRDLRQFKTEVYDPIAADLASVTTHARTRRLPASLSDKEIDELYAYIHQENIISYHFNALNQLTSKDKYTDICTGELPANASNTSQKADLYELSKRVTYIGQTLAFLDTISRTISVLKTKSPDYYTKISQKLLDWTNYLVDQRKLIQDKQKIINNHIQSTCVEAAWLAQGTGSPDLATTGSRHVTVDAGVLTLFAKDNQNKIQSIPKLFLGLNLYFRSFDKNSDFDSFAAPPKGDSSVSHHLESRRSPWRWLSLTAGFTLGTFQNKDYDNVYSGLSFTLGPSVRLGKAFRLSGGGAVMKRTSVNPIITRSDLSLGWYGSISLDYDLLTAASKIFNKFF